MHKIGLPTKIILSAALVYFNALFYLLYLPLGIAVSVLLGIEIIAKLFVRMQPGVIKKVWKDGGAVTEAPWYVWVIIVGVVLIMGILVWQYIYPAAYQILVPPAPITSVTKMTVREQTYILLADKITAQVSILDQDFKTIGSDLLATPTFVGVFEDMDTPGGYVWLRVSAANTYWLPDQTPELLTHSNSTGLVSEKVGLYYYYRLDIPAATFSIDAFVATKLVLDMYNAGNTTGITNATYAEFATTFYINQTLPYAWLKGANLTITADDVSWNATEVNVFGTLVPFTIQNDDGDDVWETDETLVAQLGNVQNALDTPQTKLGILSWQGQGAGVTAHLTLALKYIDIDGKVKTMDTVQIILSNIV